MHFIIYFSDGIFATVPKDLGTFPVCGQDCWLPSSRSQEEAVEPVQFEIRLSPGVRFTSVLLIGAAHVQSRLIDSEHSAEETKMVIENGTRRPHILMITMPFPGHVAPFIQLLYLLKEHKSVKVTVVGHPDRIAEISKLYERGDFKDLELYFEPIFRVIPVYSKDPKFPVRAATTCDQEEIEFQEMKKRLIDEKDSADAPTSMIVDMFLYWTKDIADEMDIPWYTFYSSSSWFAVCAVEAPLLLERELHPIYSAKKCERIDIPGVAFAYVSDIPHECIEFSEFYAKVSDYTLRATGILCNSSYEMEGAAGSTKAIAELVERRKKSAPGKPLEDTKVLAVGPMAQISGFGEVFSSRDDPSDSLKWLDTQAEGSVLYIAFGSLGNVISDVIPQLALGLEESRVPFLWVLKVPKGKTIDELLPQGFRERIHGRGFIETGWAPQTRILQHPATGGFLTHCGWNSIVESLCTGVPMITWPLSADQPMNARFLTDVTKVGIPIKDAPANELNMVSKEEVSAAVKRLLVSDESKEFKKNSLKLKETLASSVGDGGSSYTTLRNFINDLVTVK
ncbi:hypothetical protein R1flu_027872 [Riccia fluitans]|uniref:Glycosyltransferase n=1 Tax=Riccia fluitans TaxID=41844 RepID=A0ABD1XKK1_9MARC